MCVCARRKKCLREPCKECQCCKVGLGKARGGKSQSFGVCVYVCMCVCGYIETILLKAQSDRLGSDYWWMLYACINIYIYIYIYIYILMCVIVCAFEHTALTYVHIHTYIRTYT